ncbi:hypothetical protein BDV28DRAFT_69952 [Aspergillus coremiiformis]|uniref:Uncharacterized protein n=1 Tax=Aspergillus coremiiformis TaxID=138285 RepID=A0A5N6ZAY6_9EURO|nr:hypothetical protein BDV28DRAFT_69952 [Aspergillus coremiiformis]
MIFFIAFSFFFPFYTDVSSSYCPFGFARNVIPPLILICLCERLLACFMKEAKLTQKTQKSRKKKWHDIGVQLVISSHVMIKVCDGYMKTPIVRGVLHGLYTEIHFWDPLLPAVVGQLICSEFALCSFFHMHSCEQRGCFLIDLRSITGFFIHFSSSTLHWHWQLGGL